MSKLLGSEFRWFYYDEDTGDQWTRWHTVTLPCAACCSNGPSGGKHQQQCVYYDDPDDYMPVFSGHTRLDPYDVPPGRIVEWRTS